LHPPETQLDFRSLKDFGSLKTALNPTESD
jgi:hypothetical protein